MVNNSYLVCSIHRKILIKLSQVLVGVGYNHTELVRWTLYQVGKLEYEYGKHTQQPLTLNLVLFSMIYFVFN